MPDLVAEYRSLLTAEESLTTLDRAVELALRVAGGRRSNGHHPWPRLAGPDDGIRISPAAPAARRRVQAVSKLLQAIPRQMDAAEVPEAQYALLMDTLVLVFHHAYFSLLPKSAAHRQALLEALDALADRLPNTADRFQSKGLLDLERGEIDEAAQAFSAALAATPSDQHDFMTRVQMLWSLLLEHGHVREAFSCLTEISPRVTRIDYEEFQGLLKTTFDAAWKQ